MQLDTVQCTATDHHAPTMTPITLIDCFYICEKKFLLEGRYRVQILNISLVRDYLDKGVKAGIRYPYECVPTLTRVTNMPTLTYQMVKYMDQSHKHLPFYRDSSSYLQNSLMMHDISQEMIITKIHVLPLSLFRFLICQVMRGTNQVLNSSHITINS